MIPYVWSRTGRVDDVKQCTTRAQYAYYKAHFESVYLIEIVHFLRLLANDSNVNKVYWSRFLKMILIIDYMIFWCG